MLARFEPRFAKYWSAKVGELTSFVDRSRLVERELTAALSDLDTMRGGGGDVEPLEITASLMLQPERKGHTHARDIGSVAAVEVLAGESPEARLPIVMHELSHFAQQPILLALSRHLVRAESPAALVAQNLLDEALATSFQMSVTARLEGEEAVARAIAKPRGFYRSPRLGRRAARAALPQRNLRHLLSARGRRIARAVRSVSRAVRRRARSA